MPVRSERAVRAMPNSALQSTHSAVTPLATASVAPAGGRLNASVRRHPEGPVTTSRRGDGHGGIR
jgi:hypothetical protein